MAVRQTRMRRRTKKAKRLKKPSGKSGNLKKYPRSSLRMRRLRMRVTSLWKSRRKLLEHNSEE